MKPHAREKGLLVRELGEEVVVYDLDRHEAHCLNPSAAAVFKRCDGRSTVPELALALREDLGEPVDERWVGLALEGLEAAHLLEAGTSPAPPAEPSRRDLLRKAGLGAALLLPAVVSMVAPTPAEAAGTCIPDTACPGNDFQPCYIPPGTEECADHTCQGGSCV